MVKRKEAEDPRRAKEAYAAGREYAKQENGYLAGMASEEPEVPKEFEGDPDFDLGYYDYGQEPGGVPG